MAVIVGFVCFVLFFFFFQFCHEVFGDDSHLHWYFFLLLVVLIISSKSNKIPLSPYAHAASSVLFFLVFANLL